MKSNNENVVFFDIETTGLDKKQDRIISIGMIKTDQDGNIVDAIEQRFNPQGVKSNPEALEKHKIADEELLTEPTFEQCADRILEFMKGCDVGGHNCISFDIPFLMEEFKRCNKFFTIEGRRIIDTQKMYWNYNSKHLTDMYQEYCGKLPDCEAHDAVCDTQMTVELYKKMKEVHSISKEEMDEINGNDVRIDVDGMFVINENGKVVMGKGKYKGIVVDEVDPGYFAWMTNQDYSLETRALAQRCYKYRTGQSTK